MSLNLTTVKKRIKTISSTKKITNSMKLVSSIKSRKLANEFKNNTEFYNELVELFNNALYVDEFDQSKEFNSIYLKENKNAKKNLYVIVMSNLGLCGSYNSEVYKYFKDIASSEDEIVFIGKKCFSFFKNDYKHYDDFVELNQKRDADEVNLLTTFLVNKYLTGEYKNIKVLQSKYINSLIFKPSLVNLLPLDLKVKRGTGYEPIYEANKEQFIEKFVPQYLKNIILHCLLESSLCEETNRRNSMDNANQNIEEIMSKLQIEYNKARQASITQEITEIVSGANAIKGN